MGGRFTLITLNGSHSTLVIVLVAFDLVQLWCRPLQLARLVLICVRRLRWFRGVTRLGGLRLGRLGLVVFGLLGRLVLGVGRGKLLAEFLVPLAADAHPKLVGGLDQLLERVGRIELFGIRHAASRLDPALEQVGRASGVLGEGLGGFDGSREPPEHLPADGDEANALLHDGHESFEHHGAEEIVELRETLGDDFEDLLSEGLHRGIVTFTLAGDVVVAIQVLHGPADVFVTRVHLAWESPNGINQLLLVTLET